MDQHEADYRAQCLGAFRKYGYSFSTAHPTVSITAVSEDDEDFFLVCNGFNHFFRNCNGEEEEVEIPSPPLKLGEKVRIAEHICAALAKHKCKFVLSPHQISLCDWRCLKPVVQSMGRIAEETRIQNELIAEVEQQEEEEEEENDDEDGVLEDDEDMLMEEERLDLEAKVKAQQVEIEKKAKVLRQLDKELHDDLSGRDGDDAVRRIHTLMQELDALKLEEKEFKLACRAERDRLMQFCNDPFPDTTVEDLLNTHERIEAMLKGHRVKFASVSRIQAKQRREEDEEITPAERRQYESRFVELYEEIAAMSDLHRKQVAVFNSYTTKLRLIKGQIDLLGSIRTGFLKSKGNATAERTFNSQFPSVLAGYDASLHRSRDRLSELEKEKHELDEQLADMYTKQKLRYQQMQQPED